MLHLIFKLFRSIVNPTTDEWKIIFLLHTMVQQTHDSTQQTDYWVFWDKQKVANENTNFTLKFSAPRSMALAWPSIHHITGRFSTWVVKGIWHSTRNSGWRYQHGLSSSGDVHLFIFYHAYPMTVKYISRWTSLEIVINPLTNLMNDDEDERQVK